MGIGKNCFAHTPDSGLCVSSCTPGSNTVPEKTEDWKVFVKLLSINGTLMLRFNRLESASLRDPGAAPSSHIVLSVWILDSYLMALTVFVIINPPLQKQKG